MVESVPFLSFWCGCGLVIKAIIIELRGEVLCLGAALNKQSW